MPKYGHSSRKRRSNRLSKVVMSAIKRKIETVRSLPTHVLSPIGRPTRSRPTVKSVVVVADPLNSTPLSVVPLNSNKNSSRTANSKAKTKVWGSVDTIYLSSDTEDGEIIEIKADPSSPQSGRGTKRDGRSQSSPSTAPKKTIFINPETGESRIVLDPCSLKDVPPAKSRTPSGAKADDVTSLVINGRQIVSKMRSLQNSSSNDVKSTPKKRHGHARTSRRSTSTRKKRRTLTAKRQAKQSKSDAKATNFINPEIDLQRTIASKRQRSSSSPSDIQPAKINRSTSPPTVDGCSSSIVQTTPQTSQTAASGSENNAMKSLICGSIARCVALAARPVRRSPRLAQRQAPMTMHMAPPAMGNVFVASQAGLSSLNANRLRAIVIDASNVAMAHSRIIHQERMRFMSNTNNLAHDLPYNPYFSAKGVAICIEYFRRRGHTHIVAMVPRFRHKTNMSVDTHVLDLLERQGHLHFTPSRTLPDGRSISSYDDRYIVQYAALCNAVIVTNDNYRDLHETPAMSRTIATSLLMFNWINQDIIFFPQDPMGKDGPNLDVFLSTPQLAM